MQLGIIGNPIKHSISPPLFNRLLKMKNLNLKYVAIEVAITGLENFIKWLRHSGMLGLNITIPFKESIYAFLDWIDAPAARIKAVNTIHVVNGHLHGFNTDHYGFTESIKEIRSEIKKVLILGGGGAARAVLFSISRLGPQEIFLVERTAEKRKKLQKDFEDLPNLEILAWHESYILQKLKVADLVVNTTPLGLASVSNSFPLEPDFSLENKIFYDLIYQPAVTPFLKIGQERGALIKNGLEMLIYQAMKSLEIWTGLKTEFREWLEVYNSLFKVKIQIEGIEDKNKKIRHK